MPFTGNMSQLKGKYPLVEPGGTYNPAYESWFAKNGNTGWSGEVSYGPEMEDQRAGVTSLGSSGSFSGGIAQNYSASPLPTYKPVYKELPTYEAPKWNEAEVDTLTQKRAAPGLRGLRNQINRVSGANYENPNVKRMTLRDALAGYGEGLSRVTGSANAAAAGEYGNKFARESEGGRAAFQSSVNAITAANQQEADMSKTNYQGGLAQWESDTNYNQQQKTLDSAWNRWIKEYRWKQAEADAEAARHPTNTGPVTSERSYQGNPMPFGVRAV